MTSSKVRSTVSYWHDFPDGSNIKTKCYIGDEPIRWHLKGFKEMPDNTEIEVHVIKSVIDSVLDTPVGSIPTMKAIEKKEFTFTFKQFKEFVVKFWENGYEYFDMI